MDVLAYHRRRGCPGAIVDPSDSTAVGPSRRLMALAESSLTPREFNLRGPQGPVLATHHMPVVKPSTPLFTHVELPVLPQLSAALPLPTASRALRYEPAAPVVAPLSDNLVRPHVDTSAADTIAFQCHEAAQELRPSPSRPGRTMISPNSSVGHRFSAKSLSSAQTHPKLTSPTLSLDSRHSTVPPCSAIDEEPVDFEIESLLSAVAPISDVPERPRSSAPPPVKTAAVSALRVEEPVLVVSQLQTSNEHTLRPSAAPHNVETVRVRTLEVFGGGHTAMLGYARADVSENEHNSLSRDSVSPLPTAQLTAACRRAVASLSDPPTGVDLHFPAGLVAA